MAPCLLAPFLRRTNRLHDVIALLLLTQLFGCRATQFLSSSTLTTEPKLAAVAAAKEAKEHHHAEKLLESISQRAHEPPLDALVTMLQDAESARHRRDSRCVALYATVALSCWPLLPDAGDLETSDGSQAHPQASVDDLATSDNLPWLIYHYSLQQLTQEADRFGVLAPQHGISVVDPIGNPAFIEITRNGFPWNPEDFNQLHAVDRPLRSHLKRYWSEPGLGIPMVAIRQRAESETHMGKSLPFAATAVLRPTSPSTDANHGIIRQASFDGLPSTDQPPTIATLELHDPLRAAEVTDNRRTWKLTRDLSAPLGFAQSHLNRDNLKSFLNPGRNDEYSGIRMIEPYQPGKIPVLFVHGLLSDRLTWLDLINDLRSTPWITDHYQIWLYQYPTGQPFVISARDMRQSLDKTIRELDPNGTDEALSRIVLVGHSMGGLVSKLLITSSGDALWNSVANRPIDEVTIAPEKRQAVEAIFYFEPLPSVKRVVFIGSPHRGSQIANGWIGKLGSALVHGDRERTRATKALLHENPGVFKDLEKHLPTSVDLLQPDNPALLATYQLPVNPAVVLHTIIGNGHPVRDGTDADGVVPVESARHPETESEKLIECSHTGLPDHPETTRELTRILGEHLQNL